METHFRLLWKWNRRLNLTSLRDERAVVRRHFLESLQASPFVADSGILLDFGSGNGFPGVVLRLLNPGIRLKVLDSSGKKCSFLRELFRVLGWDVADVIHRRVDRVADLEGLGGFRYIAVRGVKLSPRLFQGLLGTLRPGGELLVFTGAGLIPALGAMAGPGCRILTHTLAGADPTCLAVIRTGDVPRGTSS
jgi:16S rRNA (guanine527-N7)-methyltransferase